jgi:hypothetical protein
VAWRRRKERRERGRGMERGLNSSNNFQRRDVVQLVIGSDSRSFTLDSPCMS